MSIGYLDLILKGVVGAAEPGLACAAHLLIIGLTQMVRAGLLQTGQFLGSRSFHSQCLLRDWGQSGPLTGRVVTAVLGAKFIHGLQQF